MASQSKENKRARFVRLASKRTNEVLDKLRILGGTSDRKRYDYTEQDVKKIFKAIDDEIKRVKALFSDDKREQFRLEV
ncbi:MAG: hypothetical protein ACFFER_20085 [Candidatus Thorarchaeota archaeon]